MDPEETSLGIEWGLLARLHTSQVEHNVSPDDAQAFQITGRQQLIHNSLAQKSQEMADLYGSALRVYRDDGNPARLILAAHSIREMTDSLPKVLDLPVLAEQGRLGDRVNALEPIWNGAAKSDCHQKGVWAGEIDGPLLKLLQALQKFFQWWKESRPKRRDVAAAVFRRTDPSGLSLPETLERKRVDKWLSLHDYFVRVAHRSSTTPEEFTTAMEELEQILLDSLYRRPSEDLSAIDGILEEERPDA
jgi:hypothetical protein